MADGVYAIQTGRASYNPIPDLRGALPTAIGGNFAAITDPVKVGELLRAMDGFNGMIPRNGADPAQTPDFGHLYVISNAIC